MSSLSNRSTADARKMVGLSPFLLLLKPEKLSLITILELMHLQDSGGVIGGMKTARALLAVGKAVDVEENEDWSSDWTQVVRVKIGSFLVDCLMDVATLPTLWSPDLYVVEYNFMLFSLMNHAIEDCVNFSEHPITL